MDSFATKQAVAADTLFSFPLAPDIAGFTAWSAEREPEAVFELLGTLYNSFDALAARRRVFKVETIGDWYVLDAHYVAICIHSSHNSLLP